MKNYQNNQQDQRIKWLEEHYTQFNSEMGDVKINTAKISNDMNWIKNDLRESNKLNIEQHQLIFNALNSQKNWIVGVLVSIIILLISRVLPIF